MTKSKPVDVSSVITDETVKVLDQCRLRDEARIVVFGTRGYYRTGRVDHYGGSHNEGGYFRLKSSAANHGRELSRRYGLPLVDETE